MNDWNSAIAKCAEVIHSQPTVIEGRLRVIDAILALRRPEDAVDDGGFDAWYNTPSLEDWSELTHPEQLRRVWNAARQHHNASAEMERDAARWRYAVKHLRQWELSIKTYPDMGLTNLVDAAIDAAMEGKS